jgi:hypothetical protein
VVVLSELWWPEKGKMGNYTMFYSGRVKAEKGVAIVMKNAFFLTFDIGGVLW